MPIAFAPAMPRPDHDPKGYYALLGLKPTDDAASIKSAWRARAKLLHPDRNPAPEAARAFRGLSEAYAVLGRPPRRLAYRLFGDGDALAAEARHCSRCGRMAPRLRIVAFHRVTSRLVSARTAELRGIFCRSCASRTALGASATTWLFGWWSPTGLVLTPLALLRNLTGGTMPRADNARLLLDQARAFLGRGQPEIALALVEEARPLARHGALAPLAEDLSRALSHRPRPRRAWAGLRWPFAAMAIILQLFPFLAAAVITTLLLRR